MHFTKSLLASELDKTKTNEYVMKSSAFWLVSHQSIQIRLLRMSDCRKLRHFGFYSRAYAILYSFWFRIRATLHLEVVNLAALVIYFANFIEY